MTSACVRFTDNKNNVFYIFRSLSWRILKSECHQFILHSAINSKFLFYQKDWGEGIQGILGKEGFVDDGC